MSPTIGNSVVIRGGIGIDTWVECLLLMNSYSFGKWQALSSLIHNSANQINKRIVQLKNIIISRIKYKSPGIK